MDHTGVACRRVLVVDDNQDAARSVVTLLEMLGHTATFRISVPEALAAALEFLPDVALLDLNMPQLNGFDLARTMKSVPALCQVKCIALSGDSSVDLDQLLDECGFKGRLLKPIDMSTLEKAIR